MATHQGFISPAYPAIARLTDTGYLDGLVTHRAAWPRIYPTAVPIEGRVVGGGKQNVRAVKRGSLSPTYYDDLYRGVHVIPPVLNVGAISTNQHYGVQIWHAWRYSSANLRAVTVTGGEGISVTGPATPSRFVPLALKKWQIAISMIGPSTIDCTVTWHFDGLPSVSLHISGARATNWTFVPDWSEEVVETLQFLTAVHQSVTGAEQRIARRLSPRRSFEFRVTVTDIERQQFENLLYALGSRVWMLPIFTDATLLAQPALRGDNSLSVETAGRDFYPCGQVLLVQLADPSQPNETAEVIEVLPGALKLSRALQRTHGTQTTVYPLRPAILTDMPQITRLSDGVSRIQVRLQIHEHNGYSDDVSHLPLYRGKRVLEPTSEWSEDISAQYQRLIAQLDNQTGRLHYMDTAQKVFQLTSHRFMPSDRQTQQKLRQLFYFLRGRQRAVWVASSATDMTPCSGVEGNVLDIEPIGYGSALLHQSGRRDIRIELTDGRVFYRRINAATFAPTGAERLILDGGVLSIKRGEILKISYLTLSRLEQDNVTWTHHTDADGLATVTVSFRGVRDELE